LDTSFDIVERKKNDAIQTHVSSMRWRRKEKGKELHHHYRQTEQVDV